MHTALCKEQAKGIMSLFWIYKVNKTDIKEMHHPEGKLACPFLGKIYRLSLLTYLFVQSSNPPHGSWNALSVIVKTIHGKVISSEVFSPPIHKDPPVLPSVVHRFVALIVICVMRKFDQSEVAFSFAFILLSVWWVKYRKSPVALQFPLFLVIYM